MSRRLKTSAILLTSGAAITLGLARFIYRQQQSPSTESDADENDKSKLSSKKCDIHYDIFLTSKENSSTYIPIESTDAVTIAIYNQALQYVKQTCSNNVHIREHGLTHLAKIRTLPAIYYSLLSQQLNYHSAIQLARTYEANTNLFPIGPPYIFSMGNKKVLTTGSIDNVNDDDVLLHTIRNFLDKLIDETKRPLDILSHHYLQLLKSYMDDVDSKTVFDLVQHFEAEHADISLAAIKRYRSNLALYSIFLYALRGYADRYPIDVIHLNGLQILKYLYEKRKDNIPFVRFLGKILLLLSRDHQTHEAFYAVGWVRILHAMALDKNNIIYSLMASTILANLDRQKYEKTYMNEEEIIANKNVKPLHLPSEMTHVELHEAEKKVEKEKEKELLSKKRRFLNKFLRFFWYSRSVSDEDMEKKTKPTLPSWINDQVYGDKVILFSPTMYNIQTMDPDVRWHQEPIIDVIFFHGLAGSAFKTWRQESESSEDQTPSVQISDQQIEDDTEELYEINEETNWDKSKMKTSHASIHKINQDEPSLCWPKDWLSKDLSTSHIRMLAVDYESTVSEWQIRSMPKNIIRRSMHDRAKEIAEQLKQAGVGKRPIIWVAHSMGGLLTKYILTNEENEDIRTNTQACVFFSVPHFGAELASLGIRHAFIVRPTVEIEELQTNSKNLLNLHEKFLQVVKKHDNIKILSFAENEKTTFSLRYQTVVVPSESSQINIGKFFILNKNHIYVCKPNSKKTIEYQELCELIQTIYHQRKNELKTQPVKLSEDILNKLYIFSSPVQDDVL